MRGRIVLMVGLASGCTTPEDALALELPDAVASPELEFVIAPTRAADRGPTPAPARVEDEPPPPPGRTPTRWTMWRVTEDVDAWLRMDAGLASCEVELPRLPAVAADGQTIAIGLASSPVADQRLMTVRVLRVADAKLVRGYTLIGPAEDELPEGELQRRACHRLTKLARALAGGGFETMTVVGGWQNPARDGLPEREGGWPVVLADGATRDVDMAVADIVIVPADASFTGLELRVEGPTRCRSDSGQASRAWEAAGLRVLTREPCGC